MSECWAEWLPGHYWPQARRFSSMSAPHPCCVPCEPATMERALGPPDCCRSQWCHHAIERACFSQGRQCHRAGGWRGSKSCHGRCYRVACPTMCLAMAQPCKRASVGHLRVETAPDSSKAGVCHRVAPQLPLQQEPTRLHLSAAMSKFLHQGYVPLCHQTMPPQARHVFPQWWLHGS